MEGIPETDETERPDLVGDHARDAAAHRLAPDDETRPSAERLDDLLPRVAQDGLAVGGAAPASGLAPRAHVRKLEARDPDLFGRETARDRVHPRGVHRSARAVRENDGRRRGLRSVE